jgi:hypothetical protein
MSGDTQSTASGGNTNAAQAGAITAATPNGLTTSRGVIATAGAAAANDAAVAKALASPAAPVDAYGAVLREIARANTQMQMRATNGQAGSILGIGTYGNAAPSTVSRGSGLGVHLQGEQRQVGSTNPNVNQTSANLLRLRSLSPFSGATRGLF